MEYLCERQISIGGGTYCPGEIIPDGVVLGCRAGKLRSNGYISEIRAGVDAAKLAEPVPGAWEGTVRIPVKCAANGERMTDVFAKPEEIRQVFFLLQLNAEEGAKELSGVCSENVLTLLCAADSRATMKHAAKKRADSLFLADKEKKDAGGGGQSAKGIAKEKGVMASGDGEA